MIKWHKKLKEHFKEIAKTKTDPHYIALGFALGALLAILPTPGFSILLGLAIIVIYPKISKYALLIAMVVFNPLVNIPLYILSFKIGNMLFSSEPIIKYNIVILNTLYNFSRRFLVGNIIIASTAAVTGYFVTKKVAKVYQHRQNVLNQDNS